MLVPSVEDPAQEITILLRRNGKVSYTTCLGIRLDTGYELQKADFVFYKEIEYLVGMVGIYVVQQNQQIEFDFEFAAVIDSTHNPVPCTRTGKIETVVIMILFWSVDADPNETHNLWSAPERQAIKTDMLVRLCDRMAWTADPLPLREAMW